MDAVVHPTNSSFSLSGQCGRWHCERERERGGGRGRERDNFILTPFPSGTSLKTAGGESFEAAVKEISDKALNLGEGTVHINLKF